MILHPAAAPATLLSPSIDFLIWPKINQKWPKTGHLSQLFAKINQILPSFHVRNEGRIVWKTNQFFVKMSLVIARRSVPKQSPRLVGDCFVGKNALLAMTHRHLLEAKKLICYYTRKRAESFRHGPECSCRENDSICPAQSFMSIVNRTWREGRIVPMKSQMLSLGK